MQPYAGFAGTVCSSEEITLTACFRSVVGVLSPGTGAADGFDFTARLAHPSIRRRRSDGGPNCFQNLILKKIFLAERGREWAWRTGEYNCRVIVSATMRNAVLMKQKNYEAGKSKQMQSAQSSANQAYVLR